MVTLYLTAIAMAIGAYLNVQYPELDPKIAAVGAYFVFMTLNILGVSIAATFELVVTVLAVAELLVFMGVVAPGFSFSNFVLNGWSGANEFSIGACAARNLNNPEVWVACITRLEAEQVVGGAQLKLRKVRGINLFDELKEYRSQDILRY